MKKRKYGEVGKRGGMLGELGGWDGVGAGKKGWKGDLGYEVGGKGKGEGGLG